MQRFPALVLVLCGCPGPPDRPEPFTLTISPRFIVGQDVLDGNPAFELLVDPPEGDPVLYPLGEASPGATLQLPQFPAPPAGTTIGLLAETPGGTPSEWDADLTRGYGQAVLGGPIEPGVALALEILVPQYGQVGEWGGLGDDKRFQPAVALVPGGDVFMFGGHDPAVTNLGVALDDIFVMRDTDEGKGNFKKVAETLPSVEIQPLAGPPEEQSGRAALTATAVYDGDEPRIFVAGGRARWWETGGSTDQWLLFDPVTEQIDRKGTMTLPRSGHLAVPFDGGRVLLFGGLTANVPVVAPSYTVFSPNTRSFDDGEGSTSIDAEYLWAMGAPYRDDVVVCGGMTFTAGAWTPVAGCNRIASDATIEPFEALPGPLAAGAMAPLPGGGLLVTGGASDTFTDPSMTIFGSTDATSVVYRYDGSWEEVATLQNPRAHHAMIPLADGRVLIVGGTSQATAFYGDLPDAVPCPELYDPADDSLTTQDCGDAGQGATPGVAWLPGEDAFVLEGFTGDAFGVYGCNRYGLTSTGPPL